ncbi:MAG: SnoaL-like domain-containing protein [Acidimicrobiales bacterium]|nr:SnoaL-like domain-containing protein [Acidimicrobiales bacterium]
MNDAPNHDQIIRDFAAAWGAADVDAIMAAFTADATYHNIPMDPLEGTEAIRGFIEGFIGDGVPFDIHHQVCNGNLVMNERTDTITFGGKTVSLPVMGVFELTADGQISAWRDYFDMTAFTGG